VLWEYQSTGRCTDAGARNFLDKFNEQSTGHKRQGLDLNEMNVEACSGVREMRDDAGSC
jgi:hypothetical protein